MLVAVDNVAPEAVFAAGMDEQLGDFSPGGKEVLGYIAGRLKALLVMTDDELGGCDKIEQWWPEAALLYGE
jgi:hypothetical protein